jgi:ABC-type branched-subunit amino acid transport system substrate-binding protein
MKYSKVLFASCIASGLMFSAAFAENGVSAESILFGQAAPLTGPAASLGLEMQAGLRAAFEEANRNGGVNGRKLKLTSVDDGYEPTKSIEATKRLLEEDKVFALVGPVGTPTSAATQPIALQAGVPFIGPFTGAEFLRNPFQPNVLNVRASYFQETEEMVERLVKDRGVSRISILFQDDAFGRAGLEGVQKALSKRNMSLASEGSFERNTVAVKSALLSIQKGKPEAVIMIGSYAPCAEFIKLARQIKFNPTFVNISFVGSDALAKELGTAGAGVVVTQVVPFPHDEKLPLVVRYRAALKALDAEKKPGFVSLEGYMVGRLVVAGLEKLKDAPTRNAFLDTVRANSFDLGGAKLVFGANDNQGMDEVFLSIIRDDGAFEAIKDLKGAGG